MPWEDEEEQDGEQKPRLMSSHTAWRALISIIGFFLIAVIVGVLALFFTNRGSIGDTQRALRQIHSLSCLTGAFFVGQPVERQPGQSHHEFVAEIRKAEAFLKALNGADCSDIRGAEITSGQIHHQLHRFSAILHGEPTPTRGVP